MTRNRDRKKQGDAQISCLGHCQDGDIFFTMEGNM